MGRAILLTLLALLSGTACLSNDAIEPSATNGPAVKVEVTAPTNAVEGVVLLHGLLRTPKSMKQMVGRLSGEGYVVANVGYPSHDRHPAQLPLPEPPVAR